jgi:acyl-coenzyme A thioesterase PaaI-like protein
MTALQELARPGHTAIVTQECQGAVIGPNAGLAVLATEARRVALPNIVRLLPAARAARVHVVHCLVQRRPDGLGANHNAKIFAIGSGVDIAPGTPGATLLPELGPEPLGHPLMPPWTITESGPGGVTMQGHFTRYHVGGNNAVHGGVIPLFFDWHFGMIVSAADRPASRTAYLHIDYRKITPIDEPLVARGAIDRLEGRKAFVTATMTTVDGTLLSEAHGLMIRLLPHQP